MALAGRDSVVFLPLIDTQQSHLSIVDTAITETQSKQSFSAFSMTLACSIVPMGKSAV